MVREAEEFAEKDKEKKAIIDVKNEADTLIYSAERSLNEHKDKLPQVSNMHSSWGRERSYWSALLHEGTENDAENSLGIWNVD